MQLLVISSKVAANDPRVTSGLGGRPLPWELTPWDKCGYGCKKNRQGCLFGPNSVLWCLIRSIMTYELITSVMPDP